MFTIEARAGETGKGFKVIARRIGKLTADSEKPAVNTRNMGRLIGKMGRGNLRRQSGVIILAEKNTHYTRG